MTLNKCCLLSAQNGLTPAFHISDSDYDPVNITASCSSTFVPLKTICHFIVSAASLESGHFWRGGLTGTSGHTREVQKNDFFFSKLEFAEALIMFLGHSRI